MALIAALVMVATETLATDVTWQGGNHGGPNKFKWNVSGNWDAGVLPTLSDNVFFGTSAYTRVTNSAASFAGSVTFNSGADSFTLAGTSTLTMGSGGITNNSSVSQTFLVPIILTTAQTWNAGSAAGGSLAFGGTVTNAGFLLTIDGANNTAISGIVSGTGGLTKNGAGTLTLSGPNTYSGTTTVSAGKVKVQNNTALGNTAGATSVASGAAIVIDGTAGALSIAENITLIGNGGGSGALENVFGPNTESGTLAFGGAARINSTAGTLTLSGAISGNGNAMTFGGAGSITISSIVSGTGSPLTYDGGGTLTLSGANTYTGDTTISAGTLKLGANNVIPNGSGKGNVSVSGVLDLAGFSQTVNGLSGGGSVNNSTGSGSLTAGNNNASSTFAGVISGATALNKTGTGTLTLSGNSTYTGGTTLSQGTLKLGADNALGTGGFNFAGGILEVNNTTDDTIGVLTLSASSTLSLGVGGASGRLTFTSASAGAVGTLTITGWSGSEGGAGTDDQIYITADPTGSGMLDHIVFDLGGGNIHFAEWVGGSHELVASVTPVPEPINVALGAFAAVFLVFGFGRRLYTSTRGKQTLSPDAQPNGLPS